MRCSAFLLAAVLSLGSGGADARQEKPPVAPPVPKVQPDGTPLRLAPGERPPVQQPVPKFGTGWLSYYGTVTEVGKDSITIRHADWDPVRFPASEVLVSGGFAKQYRQLPGRQPRGDASPSEMYRLSDVQVGDWVTIDYVVIDGAVTCDHIGIHKRPGGKMPPLPKEAEDLLNPYERDKVRIARFKAQHPDQPPPPPLPPDFFGPYIPYNECWDAYWDLEDKGIAYPEKFGKRRRFPEAPMPREKKPGPTISQ